MKIIAKHQTYTHRFKITLEAALSTINLPLDWEFSSLKDMLSFFEKIDIVSNNVHFKCPRSKNDMEDYWKDSCAISESIGLDMNDIYEKFEEKGFEINSADTAFWAIESSCLIRDLHKYHSKKVRCQINKKTYTFYFDIKKTYNWKQ